MDEAVRLALAKWPNVPSCTGWLRLSRRGEWRVPEGPVRHAGLRDFIGRNYQATPDGRWFFQNGPQQVFVDLDYTPTVLHLENTTTLRTHTGAPVRTVRGAWFDEEGCLLLECEHGIALLDDRDLAAFCTHLDGDLETPGAAITLAWADSRLTVGTIRRDEVATRFGFTPTPGG